MEQLADGQDVNQGKGTTALPQARSISAARPIDFLVTEERDEQAARCFLTKAISRHGMPETISIDGNEANAAAMQSYNKGHGPPILIRWVK
jgi:putative transposase